MEPREQRTCETKHKQARQGPNWPPERIFSLLSSLCFGIRSCVTVAIHSNEVDDEIETGSRSPDVVTDDQNI